MNAEGNKDEIAAGDEENLVGKKTNRMEVVIVPGLKGSGYSSWSWWCS